MYNEKSYAASRRYKAAHIHRITFEIQNEEYDRIKAAAVASGESVNGYIKRAIRDRLSREASADGEPEAAGDSTPGG